MLNCYFDLYPVEPTWLLDPKPSARLWLCGGLLSVEEQLDLEPLHSHMTGGGTGSQENKLYLQNAYSLFSSCFKQTSNTAQTHEHRNTQHISFHLDSSE